MNPQQQTPQPQQNPTIQPVPNPAPQPPQQPYQQYPPQKPKGISTKTLILIIVGPFIALIILGAVASFVLSFMSSTSSMKRANGFVEAVVTKDYEEAYTYFSPELKEKQPLEAFKLAFALPSYEAMNADCVFTIENRNSSADTSADGSSQVIGGSIKCGSALYPTILTFGSPDDGKKLLAYSILPPEEVLGTDGCPEGSSRPEGASYCSRGGDTAN